MPLYEYECDACGHRFEIIQKFSDPPPDTCPKCGGPVHKMQSAPSFQFKGTGFYITDYPKKDSGGKGESESKDGKDGKDGKDKTEKTEKTGKSEKTDKAESSEKKDNPAASDASTASSTTTSPSPSKS